jgi:molecular chaperone DnaK
LVSTVVDNQRTVKIHVLQGEEPKARQNTSLGQFELTGIQPGEAGTPRIRVKFAIDSNGMVQVTARDLRSGVQESVEIDAPTGMTKQEVERLRDEASSQEEAQAEDRQLRQLRKGVEERLVAIEALLRNHRGSLHKSELSGIEQALKRGRMALMKSSDRSNLKDLAAYLQRVETHVQSKV